MRITERDLLIYILDDEQEILDLLDFHFTKNGYSIVTFNTIEKFYKALEFMIPNVVITDLVFGSEKGSVLIEFLNYNFPDIEVFVMSGFLTAENKLRISDKFVRKIVTKPFDIEEFSQNFMGMLSSPMV